MILAIYPGEDGNVKKLIFKSQGKTGYFPGFQPEVGTEAHGWAGFRVSRKD